MHVTPVDSMVSVDHDFHLSPGQRCDLGLLGRCTGSLAAMRSRAAKDLENPQPLRTTWASRIGPSNGMPKAKTALPWAGSKLDTVQVSCRRQGLATDARRC